MTNPTMTARRLPYLFALALAVLACIGCAGRTAGPRGGFLHEHAELTARCPAGPGHPGSPAVIHACTIVPDRPFIELVLSFNADIPPGTGLAAEVRVPVDGGAMSSWRRLAEWGETPDAATPASAGNGEPCVRVAIDELHVDPPAARADIRVIAFGRPDRIRLHRLDVVTTSPSPRVRIKPAPGDRVEWPVPFIPNQTDDPALRARLCSPTSLNMLINHRRPGVRHADVVQAVYDAGHDLYGVWPRAIQAAWEQGVPGRLARFTDWREVRDHLQRVGPIAISITASAGEVGNMPYDPGGGHLVVLAGLTERGDAIVLDPALSDRADAHRVYPAEDLARVWLRRKRGTAYALFPPGEPLP